MARCWAFPIVRICPAPGLDPQHIFCIAPIFRILFRFAPPTLLRRRPAGNLASWRRAELLMVGTAGIRIKPVPAIEASPAAGLAQHAAHDCRPAAFRTTAAFGGNSSAIVRADGFAAFLDTSGGAFKAGPSDLYGEGHGGKPHRSCRPCARGKRDRALSRHLRRAAHHDDATTPGGRRRIRDVGQ
jgi:hypothetical protein